MVVIGVANATYDVALFTIFQRGSPNDDRAPVLSVLEAVIGLGAVSGSLLAPVLLSVFGTRGALIVGRRHPADPRGRHLPADRPRGARSRSSTRARPAPAEGPGLRRAADDRARAPRGGVPPVDRPGGHRAHDPGRARRPIRRDRRRGEVEVFVDGGPSIVSGRAPGSARSRSCAGARGRPRSSRSRTSRATASTLRRSSRRSPDRPPRRSPSGWPRPTSAGRPRRPDCQPWPGGERRLAVLLRRMFTRTWGGSPETLPARDTALCDTRRHARPHGHPARPEGQAIRRVQPGLARLEPRREDRRARPRDPRGVSRPLPADRGLAGMAAEFDAAGPLEIVEDRVGTGSTDFWGISFSPSSTEHGPMDEAAARTQDHDPPGLLGVLRRRRCAGLAGDAEGPARRRTRPRRGSSATRSGSRARTSRSRSG